MKAYLALVWLAFLLRAAGADITRSTNEGLELFLFRSDAFSPARVNDGSNSSSRKLKQFAAYQEVFVKNVSDGNLTIPLSRKETATISRAFSNGRDSWEEYLFGFRTSVAPDGSPLVTPDLFVTLRPGESARLPSFAATADAGEHAPRFIVIYEVSKEYGARFQCWSGRITVEQPATILYPQPPKPKAVTPTATQPVSPPSK